MIARIGEWLPRGWRDLFLQFLIYFTAKTTYDLARGMAGGSIDLAFANGERIMDVERRMGLMFEPAAQDMILNFQWLIDAANLIYLNSQFAIAISFLVWMYLFRNSHYYFFRNMIFVSFCLALVGYVGFPTAPPRMFPEYGFIDTVNAHSSVNHDSEFAKLVVNPFAAVPSMHCAVALMIGGTGFMACKSWIAKGFWATWPILVASVTVVTANHYWLDVALGWAVAGIAFLIAAKVIAKMKPDVWSWNRTDTQPVPKL